MQNNYTSSSKFQSNLFVVPTEEFDDLQYILDILKLHFAERSRKDNSIWLIGINIDKNLDEKATIMARFSVLDLDYDDDVFVYNMGGEWGWGVIFRLYLIVAYLPMHGADEKWTLYEIYKIGQDDERITVLPFGNWELPDGKLVYDKSEKYLRRRNLMVIFSKRCSKYLIFDTT